jgi:heme-degrading monooxygenase HmoA
MFFVSATRLRINSVFRFPAFLMANEASAKALVRTEGFIKGVELTDKRLTFWTVTIWESGSAMLVFRNSDAHRKAMQKLPYWCNEATYAHWQQEMDEIPSWNEIHYRITKEGKPTKVRNPTPDQASLNFPPVRWTRTVRPLRKKI